jgi:uncharacterized membrane protein
VILSIAVTFEIFFGRVFPVFCGNFLFSAPPSRRPLPSSGLVAQAWWLRLVGAGSHFNTPPALLIFYLGLAGLFLQPDIFKKSHPHPTLSCLVVKSSHTGSSHPFHLSFHLYSPF